MGTRYTYLLKLAEAFLVKADMNYEVLQEELNDNPELLNKYLDTEKKLAKKGGEKIKIKQFKLNV